MRELARGGGLANDKGLSAKRRILCASIAKNDSGQPPWQGFLWPRLRTKDSRASPKCHLRGFGRLPKGPTVLFGPEASAASMNSKQAGGRTSPEPTVSATLRCFRWVPVRMASCGSATGLEAALTVSIRELAAWQFKRVFRGVAVTDSSTSLTSTIRGDCGRARSVEWTYGTAPGGATTT